MRQQLLAVVAIASWATFLTAVGELLEDRRQRVELARAQELAAAAKAGAIAATLIHAVTDHLADDDLEAADCSDVLELCPDPTRHEPATAAAGDEPC